jgi:hypothetical protein
VDVVLHKENIFRYLVLCFIVALVGLVTTWMKMESQNRVSMASTVEPSSETSAELPLSNTQSSQPQ